MGRLGTASALAAALAAAIALTASAGAAPNARTEQRVKSAAPDAGRVAESYVRVRAPLPGSAGAHPEACDWLGYLRFRDVNGPRRAGDADAIVTAMPGFLSGAAPLDQLARNFVRRMSDRGKHVEFWALDRRANCLEDHTGIDAAARARDANVAYDYYWRGKAIDGHTFAGWKTASQTRWLDSMGLAQTVRDWYSVLTKEIPDRSVRRRKVFCGGHSLGGPITTAFAGWDFDGNPATKADAGYEQCAGFFGLDTSLGSSGFDSSSGPGAASFFGPASSGSPFVSAPPFTPETLQVPDVFGVGAFFQPQRTNLIEQLPHSSNIDLSQRVLFSRDAANFATGSPSIRDFHLTNEVALAGVFDDNSEPITILRASLGTTEGGPVAEKKFPGASTPLTNNDFTMIPSDTGTPLYRWRDYDQMAGAPKQVNDAGQPYTSAKSEKSDLHQLARVTFEAPADFAEQYFPTRLFADSIDEEGGDRSGSLADMRYDGVAKRPAFLIQAGDSESNSGASPRTTSRGTAPNSNKLSGAVTLPGYNHIDVTAAAWRQNDGRPEGSSKALSDFSCRVLGSCARSCLARRAPVGPRGLGRVKLGRTRRALRRLPGLARRTRHSYRFCVKGGVGSVRAAFSRRGRALLVATTAPGHRKRRVHTGSRSRSFRRAFRHRVRIGRGLYRAGRRSRLVIGVRRGRVRFLATASRSLVRRPRTLRRYLHYAGVR